MSTCRIRRVTKRVYKAGLPMPLNRHRSCQGQSIIEFALVAMTFFLLSFALIDFSWLMFSQMNMQDAVREAGRYAATGNVRSNADPTAPRTASIRQVLNQLSAGTNIENVTITSTAGGVGSPGGPGDTVQIKVLCDVPLMTKAIGQFLPSNDNKFHFTVSSTFKNEPFPATTPIN